MAAAGEVLKVAACRAYRSEPRKQSAGKCRAHIPTFRFPFLQKLLKCVEDACAVRPDAFYASEVNRMREKNQTINQSIHRKAKENFFETSVKAISRLMWPCHSMGHMTRDPVPPANPPPFIPSLLSVSLCRPSPFQSIPPQDSGGGGGVGEWLGDHNAPLLQTT